MRAVAAVEDYEKAGDDDGVDRRDDDDATGVSRAEPDALSFAAAVEVGDRHEEAQRDRRQDDAGPGLVHVQQQFLQIEEVPRRLRRVGRDVGVGAIQQRRVDQR
jgi:hypothetical protein